MQLKKNHRGFTLIELLVVIAIIGILSSIVLVSVNSARNKAKDVAAKADLTNMRAAAELYYDSQSPTSYSGFCTDTGINGGARNLAGADAANGTGDADCNDSATQWAACADLVADSTNAWCVDYLGNAKTMPVATCVAAWAATVCP